MFVSYILLKKMYIFVIEYSYNNTDGITHTRTPPPGAEHLPPTPDNPTTLGHASSSSVTCMHACCRSQSRSSTWTPYIIVKLQYNMQCLFISPHCIPHMFMFNTQKPLIMNPLFVFAI